MSVSASFRAATALLLIGCLLCPPAQALVSFNDGKEHLFVTGTAGASYDSNILAHAGGGGDTIYSAGVLLEYTRRAGLIGVDASVGVDLSQFVNNRNENSTDPRFALAFAKSTGRTTGGLSLSATRENRADSAANVRAQSWDYDTTLNLKYPVIDRYSVSGTVGYTARIYDATSGLTNLSTYSLGTDLLYALTDTRDLAVGYRYRYEETSRNTAYDDQSVTAGVSGAILPRLSGSVRAGYQIRSPRKQAKDGGDRGLTASAALTWYATKRLSFTGQMSNDLSVTSTNLSMSTLSGNLGAEYVFNSKRSVSANVGGGDNRFLGAAGLDRRDEFFTFGAGVNYTMMEHLKISLSYDYFKNWSTLSYSDYDRNTFSLSLISRW